MTRSSSRRFAALCVAMVATGGLAAGEAHAVLPVPPHYYLGVTEGSTTLGPVNDTSGGVNPSTPVTVAIRRNGTVVASANGNGFADMPQVPQVGDVVSVESPPGVIAASMTYDGRPILDPTVCAGSASFSGQRTPDATVQGGYYTSIAGNPYPAPPGSSGQAHVTTVSGTSFSGSFSHPLAIGQTVYAVENLSPTLPGGATLSYYSENDRPVATCPQPAPPVVPPVTPPIPAPQGSVGLTRTTLKKLLKSGWLVTVTINQPGSVVADLFLKGGTLPATAAKVTPALRVARGTATAKSAGKVTVRLRVTAKGRKKLKHAKQAKLVLLTTLRSATGAKLDLARHTVSLHR